MIWRNFFRDLRHTASRLVSVSIITLISVMVYTALSGILYNLDRISGGYLEGQNTADYWLTGVNLDAGDCRTLAALPGVTGVQPRVVMDAEERFDSSVTLQLFAVPEDFAVNTPYLTAGRLPQSSREIAVSDVLAQARGLGVGDWYELTLTDTGQNLRLQVCGLVKSAECLYWVDATTPAPDLTRYAFAYGVEDLLRGLLGDRYNQICVTTEDSLSPADFRQAADQALGDKVVNILSLADNTQASFLMEMRDNLAPILRIFPVLFFLCAVLMMVSTMNRLVESARMDIGTFKALGYADGTILFYYLLHAVLVVIVGFPIGAWAGKYVCALIVAAVATGCDLPPYTVVHDFAAWGQALGITALCCIGSAFLVARSLLKESPAQCMRPKPPKAAKTVLLERIGPLWRRLGFSQKYIIRGTFRNKVRMFTCIFGIAFCMGLVFLAFALRDSIDCYADALSRQQNRYDLMAALDTSVTQAQYERLTRDAGVEEAELEMTTAGWLYTQDQRATAAITVAEDTVDLKRYDPYAGGPITLPEDGLVMEEALADDLGVAVGDTVSLRFTGDSRYYSVRVADTDRSASGVILSRSLWRSLGLAYTPTAVYLTAADPAALSARLDSYDFVTGWQTREAATAAAVDRLYSMSMVVYILILFGGGLACIVIYNLGIMSFFEQIRSLATLMVLGFYDREIKTLQLSENIIFAVCGILLGIPMGMAFLHLILGAVTTMPLVENTQPASLALSCGLTLVFALAVNVVIGRKMREIDMLGALKSVE